jgi:hypothetical protein
VSSKTNKQTKNHKEMSSHPRKNGYYKNRQKNASTGKDVEKREHWHTVGGTVKWCSCCEKQYGGSSKILT